MTCWQAFPHASRGGHFIYFELWHCSWQHWHMFEGFCFCVAFFCFFVFCFLVVFFVVVVVVVVVCFFSQFVWHIKEKEYWTSTTMKLRPLKTSCQTNWDSNVAQLYTLGRSSSCFALIHRSWDTKVMMTSSIKLYPHPCFVYAAQYHPGCPHVIVTGGYDNYLRVWTKLSDGLNGKVRQHCS